jgi:thymidylate kinase
VGTRGHNRVWRRRGVTTSARGGVVVIAGPDGTGKSSLCDRLISGPLAGRQVLHIHFRPGILPARAVPASAINDPQGQAPYTGWLSVLKTLYLFIDFVLGWELRVQPVVRKGGWVIIERGWWDLVVDPRRYRLRGAAGLTRLLGKLIPKPELTLVLECPLQVLKARKAELSESELVRQTQAWRALPPGTARRVFLDASRPVGEVVEHAERELLCVR